MGKNQLKHRRQRIKNSNKNSHRIPNTTIEKHSLFFNPSSFQYHRHMFLLLIHRQQQIKNSNKNSRRVPNTMMERRSPFFHLLSSQYLCHLFLLLIRRRPPCNHKIIKTKKKKKAKKTENKRKKNNNNNIQPTTPSQVPSIVANNILNDTVGDNDCPPLPTPTRRIGPQRLFCNQQTKFQNI